MPRGTRVAPAIVALHGCGGAFHDFDVPIPVRVLRNIPASINPDHTVHVGRDPDAQADVLARVPAWIAALPPVR